MRIGFVIETKPLVVLATVILIVILFLSIGLLGMMSSLRSGDHYYS